MVRRGSLLPFLAIVTTAGSASARDLAEIRKSRQLEVAAATEEIPLERDILNGFARALGVELRLVPAGSVSGALQTLAQGRADVAAGGLVAQRDQLEAVGFSAEVFPTRYIAVNRAPAEPALFIESLRAAGKILAPAGSGAAEAASAAKLPASRTDATVSTERALATLRTDAGSVLLLGLFDALVAKRKDTQLQLGVVLGGRLSVAFGVRQSDAQLLRSLNEHLAQLRASPSYRLLVARNLGEESLRVLARSHLDEND